MPPTGSEIDGRFEIGFSAVFLEKLLDVSGDMPVWRPAINILPVRKRVAHERLINLTLYADTVA